MAWGVRIRQRPKEQEESMSAWTVASPVRRRSMAAARRIRALAEGSESETQSGLKLYVQTDWARLRQQFDTSLERMNDVRLSIEARSKYLKELRRIRLELDQLEQAQGF
jgi:hypothetical protein